MASVELDFEEFRTWFPGLTEDVIPDASLEVFWEQVCEFVGNTDEKSFAPYDPDATPPKNERKALLYYALCHFATLSVRRDQPGRITHASEGSVSTGFDLIQSTSQTAQWWNQTPCGSTYWTLTAKYRMGGRLYGQSNYHPWG